jgi:hypothetical protein
MIGFAIAAGESPSALQNIANGMLAGTKMMKEDRATKQAREDKIKMLALSESNEDRRLAQRLASQERVANIRASTDEGSYKPVDRMYKSAFDNALSIIQNAIDFKGTPEEAIQQAKEIASTAYPGSQFAIKLDDPDNDEGLDEQLNRDKAANTLGL